MINQKQAVINAVLSLLPNYEMGGEVILSDVLNDGLKTECRALLFEGFRTGNIQFKETFQKKVDIDAELKKYVSGLLNNWIRKNPEFNAGNSYVAKNPGSRAGSGDESVREMRKLFRTTADLEAKAEIQEAIDARIAIIKPSAVTTINAEAIPEHLRHLVKNKDKTE